MAIKKMNIKWRRARVYISSCGHELIAHFVDVLTIDAPNPESHGLSKIGRKDTTVSVCDCP